jgi:hypothetical protein
MSTSVSTSFIRQYESLVHHVFQREGGILRPTVRTKSGVNGKSTTFQKIGKGVATVKARHGVITPMNQTHTAPECTLSDFYAGDWVDKLDEAKLNINEQEAIARGGAWALGRKVDDQIITELNNTSQTVQSLVLTGANVVRQSILEWVEALWSNDVMNDGNVYGYITPRLDAIMMTVEEYASADYVDVRRFEDGTNTLRFRNWLGVKWTAHTGASGKGTTACTGHIYHQSAIAHATGAVSANSADDSGKALHADITWHGDRASHFVNHWMSGGAKLIDDTGVIEALWSDTTAVPST